MKKILFISNVGSAKMSGSFSGTLITAAHSLGYEYHSVLNRCNTTPKQMKEDEARFNIRMHHADIARSPFSKSNIKAYKQIVKIIRDEKIDFIHCNTPVGGVLGRLAGKKCKVEKIIYQVHGFHFYKGAPLKNWLLYYPVEKLCSYLTDVLITINQEDYALAKKRMRAKQIEYVPGVGIDLSKFKNIAVDRAEKRKDIGVPENAFLLLSVGELNDNKNHQIIIQALAKLDNPNIHYAIAGNGYKKQYLLNLARELGVSEQLHLLGYRNDILQLNCISDVYCFPSFREGLSVALMEAMACARPIIASNIRGNVDLIDQNGGVLFDPHSIDDCKNAIDSIMQKDRDKLGAYNALKVKNFDSELVVKKIEEIYRSL